MHRGGRWLFYDDGQFAFYPRARGVGNVIDANFVPIVGNYVETRRGISFAGNSYVPYYVGYTQITIKGSIEPLSGNRYAMTVTHETETSLKNDSQYGAIQTGQYKYVNFSMRMARTA
jgi:hypothetical protein